MASHRLFTAQAVHLMGHTPFPGFPSTSFQLRPLSRQMHQAIRTQSTCSTTPLQPILAGVWKNPSQQLSSRLLRSKILMQQKLLHTSVRKSTSITYSSSIPENVATAPAASSPSASSNVATADAGESQGHELPRLTAPSVSTHLFIIAGLVFAIVVVGGLTRLTESGLSITEWNLVTGTLPPLSHEDWMSEYNKYMVTPEATLMNKGMSLEEFKSIYVWEWGHRFLGRIIGLAFLAPIPYFLYKKKVSKKTSAMLFTIATLIGGQGALGWYMVKSGLTHEAIQSRDGVPRVSQYRLAAHLGMAFLVYALALRHAVGIKRDWNLAKLGKAIGGKVSTAQESLHLLRTPQANKVRVLVTGLTGLVFLTAISGTTTHLRPASSVRDSPARFPCKLILVLSGAFVAGLDAGLLYNTFPYMGDRIVPPASELYSPRYSRSPDQSDLYIRNSLENPTTVQFDHRALATTTFTAIVGLFLYARRPSVAAHIPANALRAIKATMHMAVLQVALGISTLIYLVPIPLAAAHQAGSLVLLSLCVAAGAALRRPSANARKYISMLSSRKATQQAIQPKTRTIIPEGSA